MYLFRYRRQGLPCVERLHNVSTTRVDSAGSRRTRADSPAPGKLLAVSLLAGNWVRRRGLVQPQFYTFKSCLSRPIIRRKREGIPEGGSRSACTLSILDLRWTTT